MSDSALPRWRDRRFLVLLALGFSAGVPLPLTAFTLRQWFSESGISLAAIGLTALIGLAYSLKFLWAPVLDHASAPILRVGGWPASSRRSRSRSSPSA
jgi:MFS transporter, PAT family, beta-lactamase induction signal transducer AmpG